MLCYCMLCARIRVYLRHRAYTAYVIPGVCMGQSACICVCVCVRVRNHINISHGALNRVIGNV